MGSDMARQRIKMRRPFLFRLRLDGIEIGLQRRLGVHHHGFSAGQMDDDVRPEHAALARQAGLLFEIDMLHHVGHFEHVAKLVLAPSAGALRPAERLHQPAGLGTQRRLAFGELLHLLRDRAVSALARFLQFLRPLLDLLEFFPDRLDERGNGLLPRLQVLIRLHLVRLEALADQTQERIAVPAERLGGERREPRLRLAARLPDLFQTHGVGSALALKACLRPFGPAARGRGEGEPDERGARERAKDGQPDFHACSCLSRRPG